MLNKSVRESFSFLPILQGLCIDLKWDMQQIELQVLHFLVATESHM